MELHGGSVVVRSEGMGKGTEFLIRLPLSHAPAGSEPSATTPVADPHQLRVLVVEDNRDAAETLRDLLELMGCRVAVAFSGAEAVTTVRQFGPEVVLCDLGLPGLNGYQVAETLRQGPAFSSTRLIAISGYGQEEDRRRSREAGFDLHLTKPVDLTELQRVLAAPRRSARP